MPSLLTNEEKEMFQDAVNQVFETWARPQLFYKRNKIIAVTENIAHDFIWGDAPQNSAVETKLEKREIYCQIRFGRKLQASEMKRAEVTSMPILQEGEAHIIFHKQDLDFVIGADRFILEGEPYKVVSEPSPVGLFDKQKFRLHLKKLDPTLQKNEPEVLEDIAT